VDSSSYYDTHGKKFVASTVDVDMGSLYRLLLSRLRPGARILDAGCGSGRDSLAFKNLGYRVEAFDLSAEMVRSTKALADVPVRRIGFEELDYDRRFDGIWASASLLHVPRQRMPAVFSLLAKALVDRGVLYCSYKNRQKDFSEDGRSFTCYTPASFETFVRSQGSFGLLELLETEDKRVGREGERWINAVLEKR
jgi:SAM-dependent methyltransferase